MVSSSPSSASSLPCLSSFLLDRSWQSLFCGQSLGSLSRCFSITGSLVSKRSLGRNLSLFQRRLSLRISRAVVLWLDPRSSISARTSSPMTRLLLSVRRLVLSLRRSSRSLRHTTRELSGVDTDGAQVVWLCIPLRSVHGRSSSVRLIPANGRRVVARVSTVDTLTPPSSSASTASVSSLPVTSLLRLPFPERTARSSMTWSIASRR